MQRRFSVLIAATVVATAAGLAPGVADAQKIGVVDLGRVLAKSAAGVAAREQLEKEKASMQKEVDARKVELEKLKDELDKKRTLLAPDALREKQDTFDRKRRDATRLVDDLQKELEKKEQKLLQEVLAQVSGVIDRVGREKKYYLIVEKRGASVVFIAPEADITEEVIKAYDQEAAKATKK
jgi:outer membrane protein